MIRAFGSMRWIRPAKRKFAGVLSVIRIASGAAPIRTNNPLERILRQIRRRTRLSDGFQPLLAAGGTTLGPLDVALKLYPDERLPSSISASDSERVVAGFGREVAHYRSGSKRNLVLLRSRRGALSHPHSILTPRFKRPGSKARKR
jgi:hypothetical protein